jgi:hypothetical protein
VVHRRTSDRLQFFGSENLTPRVRFKARVLEGITPDKHATVWTRQNGEELIVFHLLTTKEATKRAYSRDAKKKPKNGLNFGSGNMPPD